MKLNTIKYGLFLTFVTVLMAAGGCSGDQNQSSPEDSGRIQVKWDPSNNETLAQQVKEKLVQKEEIKEAHVISTKKQLLAAVKFKTWDRFNSQQTVKKLEKQLSKQYPKRKVQVSSDKKVLMEIAKLETKLRNGEIDPKERKQKLGRIKKFLKEQ